MRSTNAAWLQSCWLACLAACLTLAGFAGAAPAQKAAQASARHAHKTSYRVVNLNAGDFFALPRINDSGQVSYSVQMGGGSPRGYFYDGALLHDIGTLGGSDTYAVALNDAGQVTGGSTILAGDEHAFTWTLGGGMSDLGVLPGATDARAAGINNEGVVVGSSDGALFSPRAFRWTPLGGIENLGAFTPGLASFSAGNAINDAGLIAGHSVTPAFDRHAFYWTPLGGLVDIDTLGSSTSIPRAVGALGQIAGTATLPGLVSHGFIWTAGSGMQDLGPLTGVIAMSPNAHIAGVLETPAGDQHAMSWTQSGGLVDLGTLGGARSRTHDVNSKGAIVGTAETTVADLLHAFVWTAKHGMVDLNKRLRHPPPGLELESALAISDNGSIVALSNAGVVLLKPVYKDHNEHQDKKDPHALGPIAAPRLVKLGAPLQAGFGFVDEDRTGTRSVTWSWGDGTPGQAARVRENDGQGSAGARHSYDVAGIHMMTAIVVDRAGRRAETGRTVVVHDGAAGTAAANGRLDSPPGALHADPTLAGRAGIAFVAPAPGAAGAGKLRFSLPGLVLRSDTLQQLPAQAGHRQFQGSGTLNGRGGYRFTMTAGRGGRIGLRIWRTDPVSHEELLVYDNRGSASPGAGPRIASAYGLPFHPAGGRLVEGEMAFH